ncbi:MAG: hypothetical protein AB4050_19045 [Synechococcus sp.]
MHTKTYEERNRHIKELLASIRQSRDALTGIYRQDMSKLQDFGFNVEQKGLKRLADSRSLDAPN